MRIKSKGKIFTLAAAFALTAALAAGVFAPAAAEEAQFPVYTQEFASEEAVNADFFAGYVNAVGNSTVAEQVGQEDGHWFLKDGKLVRLSSYSATLPLRNGDIRIESAKDTLTVYAEKTDGELWLSDALFDTEGWDEARGGYKIFKLRGGVLRTVAARKKIKGED